MKNNINIFTFTFTVILLVILTTNSQAQTTRYVKPVATGAATGVTWADASADLQAMINASAINDIVWVATGTYLPTRDVAANLSPADNRTKTFLMKSGVAVYGGFIGTETLLASRDWTTNATILSGDLGTVGTNSDNSYHVVAVNAPTNATRLDGFTIKDGYANFNADFLGYRFGNSSGGGLFATGGGTNFTLTNVTISNNKVNFYGGGIYNNSSSPTLTNVTISNNTSSKC